MLIAILSSFLISALSVNPIHEFHLSLTEIEYVEEKEEVQIITKVFTDDIELMLRKRINDNIILDYGRDETTIDSYLEKYLQDKLIISVDGEEQAFKFLGKEYESESMFVYLQITNVAPFKKINVTNRVLFDTFDDQQNVVKIKSGATTGSFLLIPNNSSRVFNLNK